MYLPKQGELENICFVAVLQRVWKLWPLVHMMLNWLYTIDFSSWILLSCVMTKAVESHNDANFKDMQDCIHKLQWF